MQLVLAQASEILVEQNATGDNVVQRLKQVLQEDIQSYASDCFTKHDTDGTGKLSQREAGVAVRFLYTELGTEPPEEAEVNELIVKSQKGEFDNDEEWVQFFSTMTQHALEAVEKSVGQRKKLAEAISAMAADAAWVKQQSSQSFAAADSDNSVC